MTKIIEIDRKVVKFVRLEAGDELHNLYPISERSQLWLVCEKQSDHAAPKWRSIGRIGWQYSQMGQLCGKEAIQAEFKDRLVDNKPIKFEAYLGLWREAIANSVHFSDLAQAGLELVATLNVPLAVLSEYDNDTRKQSLDLATRSGFVESTSDELITFKIPVSDLPTALLYAKISGWHISQEKYPAVPESVLEVVAIDREEVILPPRWAYRDLFAGVGVAP